MSENSDSFSIDQPTSTSTNSEAVGDVESLLVTDEQKALFAEVKKSVSEFERPEDFEFSLPNLVRGVDTCLETLSDEQKAELIKDDANKPLLEAQKQAELYMLQAQSKHAVFFSAKLVQFQNGNMKDFVPLIVGTMIGRAKIVLIHKDTWEVLKDYSFVVEHHRSPVDPDLSEVHAIHALHKNGAEVNYLSSVQCSRCNLAPAPFVCPSCTAPYCSSVCQQMHKAEHDPHCLEKMMTNMSLVVKDAREDLNKRSSKFEEEQAMFEKRNKGKMVLVRKIDANGKVISESEQIVIPADDNAAVAAH